MCNDRSSFRFFHSPSSEQLAFVTPSFYDARVVGSVANQSGGGLVAKFSAGPKPVSFQKELVEGGTSKRGIFSFGRQSRGKGCSCPALKRTPPRFE